MHCRVSRYIKVTLLFGPIRFSVGKSLEPVGRWTKTIGATSSDILDCVTYVTQCVDILLTVGMVSPKFAQYLKSVLAEVGKEAVFECQIHGQPAPVITWYYPLLLFIIIRVNSMLMMSFLFWEIFICTVPYKLFSCIVAYSLSFIHLLWISYFFPLLMAWH